MTVPAGAYTYSRVALIVGLVLAVATARADTPAGDKHLVLDPRVIESVEAAGLVPGEVEKDTHNPLLRAERPWENCFNNLYANVQYDDKERLFQLWYQVVLADKDAMNKLTPPATSHEVGFLVCYATSKDGVTWQRPNVGIFDYGGSTDNDGFACYEPAEAGKEGFVVTQPLRLTKGELRVNANAAGGAVRVAVLDTEGYSLDDCEPITGDVFDGVARWRGGKSLAQLAGQTVRLRFELRAAKLYSFSGTH